jgi:glycosyltransferase involved in cell wall biosynthesis
MLYGELLPMLPGFLESALLRCPYIYDFDDAFYLKYKQGKFGVFRTILGAKFDRVMRSAAAITAGNHELQSYALRHNTCAHYLPTVVDTKRYRPCPELRGSHPLTVGWIGSPSTAPYLSQLATPLALIARESPLRFVVIGGKAPNIPGVEVIEHGWSEAEEVRLINTFDIGVMPLPDDAWARGKCAFKLIQYMACGVPVIASAVGANKTVVTDGCGLLVSDIDGWVRALRTLRDDAQTRCAMGQAARLRVDQNFSLHRAVPVLASVLAAAAKETL